MPTIRIGGSGISLPNPGLVAITSGSAAGTIKGFTNTISLGAGEIWTIPSGTWWVKTGPYTFLQWLDPISNTFKIRPTAKDDTQFIASDGQNYRLANTTGCPIGAVITTGGAGYTNGIGSTATGVTVTASSGSSIWTPVVGGAVSATLSTSTGTTTAGTGYNYPPICVIDAPPQGGMQATAIVTSLTSGTVPVANVQVTNQGAGYTTVPALTFVPDPRESAAGTPGPTTIAAVVLTLTATGQLTGLYPSNHGSALTGVPALTITTSTTTAQATAIMNFCVTAFALASTTTQGSTLAAGTTVISVSNTIAASTNFLTNPLHNSTGITFPRPARIMANISAGVITSTGQVVEDNGLGIQQVPSTIVIPVITSTTSTGPLGGLGTPTVGGVTDTSFIQAA